jgi:hypothetical protein
MTLANAPIGSPESLLFEAQVSELIDDFSEDLSELTNLKKEEIQRRFLIKAREVAKYRALPSSKEAMSKAESKRQRKALRMQKQLG